ncbi:MAG: glutamate--tRNA ligase [Planctomycetes bacterium]|nr:glutamate--tRNA ligase [Planctomycetota bacterium]
MSKPLPLRTRFAPSPSGHLHVGGARTALFNWAYAKGRGGKFILRIEDTDQKRSSDAASVGFLKDLKWLGVDWQEGPVFEDCGGGEAGPYFQSERLETYNNYLDQLVREGKAYHAFDTAAELDAARKESKSRNVAYRYDRSKSESHSKAQVEAWLKEGRPSVVRFKTPAGAITIHDEILGDATLPEGEVDDFVIRKADGFPTYHFAVVVDDELMGVTTVLRAQEHFNNTAKHIVLQDALGFRRPAYGHLPLIFNPDGSKMSKRDKDKALRKTAQERKLTAPPPGTVDPARFTAWMGDKNSQLDFAEATAMAAALGIDLPEINVDDFRRSGYLPQVLCNFLALNGWGPGNDLEKFDNAYLCEHFALDRVLKTPAKFDRVKLLAFNLDALQKLSREEFSAMARAHGEAYHPEFMRKITAEQFNLLVNASHERSKTLDELFRVNRWLVLGDEAVSWEKSKSIEKALLAGTPSGLDRLRELRAVLERVAAWTPAGIEESIREWAASAGLAEQIGQVAQPLRVGVTGSTVSPPIFDTLAILGKSSSLRRIDRCLEAFAASKT